MVKILLIEDDPLIQRMYIKELQLAGFEVEVSADGDDGLLKALSVSPELILLDIMMPKKNGFQVLAELKAMEQTKNIPVIILTNLMQEQSAEKAIEGGAFDYIIKSDFEPKDVLKIVEKALGQN